MVPKAHSGLTKQALTGPTLGTTILSQQWHYANVKVDLEPINSIQFFLGSILVRRRFYPCSRSRIR
jgi:hypothetical protein